MRQRRAPCVREVKAAYMRLVSLEPSSPARGESLTLMVTAIVGGSMGRAASAFVQSG